MSSQSLDWLNSLPEGFNDAGSYRHMRKFALQRLAKNAELRQQVVDQGGEQMAIDEWDSVFAQDDADDREAVARCEQALKDMGVEL